MPSQPARPADAAGGDERGIASRTMRRHSPVLSIIVGTAKAVLMVAALATLGYFLLVQEVTGRARPPMPRPLSVYDAVADRRPLDVTVTRNWKKVRFESSADELTAAPSIWMEMHFGDWDRLPADVRKRGLARLRHRFIGVVAGPVQWSSMTPRDWDAVPQPVRMVVFPLMIEWWVDHYALGAAYGLSHRLVADTVSAIVMAESWFQHRADVVNEWGNRDIGLGQCSNRCRKDLARMAAAGLLEFSLSDDDYLNPWHATRAAVVWFGLELARAEGDVGLAIRAYHRGSAAAADGAGAEYAHNVRRLRRQYLSSTSPRSPTWQRLAAWARSSTRQMEIAPRAAANVSVASARVTAESGQNRSALSQFAREAIPELVTDSYERDGSSAVVR